MKKYILALSFLFSISLTACVTSPEIEPSTETDDAVERSETMPETTTESEPFPVEVSVFSRDELLEVSGGGCGMTLLEPGADYYKDGLLFANGLEDMPWMKINGNLSRLVLTDANGEDFYGQQTSQTFETEDGAVAVDVDVTLGERGEIESFDIPEGTITVTTEGQAEEIAVVGDAGC